MFVAHGRMRPEKPGESLMLPHGSAWIPKLRMESYHVQPALTLRRIHDPQDGQIWCGAQRSPAPSTRRGLTTGQGTQGEHTFTSAGFRELSSVQFVPWVFRFTLNLPVNQLGKPSQNGISPTDFDYRFLRELLSWCYRYWKQLHGSLQRCDPFRRR